MENELDSTDLILFTRENWQDIEKLEMCLLTTIERQLELSGLIASEDALMNSTYLSEKEDSFKSTDTLAKARAKSYVGTNRVKYEYEFEALNNLVQVLISRTSQVFPATAQFPQIS